MRGNAKLVIAILATAALIGVAALATAPLFKAETPEPSKLKLMNRGPGLVEPPLPGPLRIALRMPSTLALVGVLALTGLWFGRPRPGALPATRPARAARWALAAVGASLLAAAAYRVVVPYVPVPRVVVLSPALESLKGLDNRSK